MGLQCGRFATPTATRLFTTYIIEHKGPNTDRGVESAGRKNSPRLKRLSDKTRHKTKDCKNLKKTVDKQENLCYYIGAVERLRNARVVELVDSLDSGSSVHSGRAGSTPASRTKENALNRKI